MVYIVLCILLGMIHEEFQQVVLEKVMVVNARGAFAWSVGRGEFGVSCGVSKCAGRNQNKSYEFALDNPLGVRLEMVLELLEIHSKMAYCI